MDSNEAVESKRHTMERTSGLLIHINVPVNIVVSCFVTSHDRTRKYMMQVLYSIHISHLVVVVVMNLSDSIPNVICVMVFVYEIFEEQPQKHMRLLAA